MRNDLIRYHKIEDKRIAVTGWPQTDVYCERRPRDKYLELISSFGMDPRKASILIAGNSITNAPFEPAFFKRLIRWWESGEGKERFNLIFRPHPKDQYWKERFDVANVQGRPGIFVQSPTYMDLDVLSLLLQHVECVITNAGTILLDSLVNDRPTVSVLYDEGEPPGSCFAYKNVVGEHYKELMASAAFYRADNFDEVVRGIESCVSRPSELAKERKNVSSQIMGELDGKAAARVVDAIMAGLGLA